MKTQIKFLSVLICFQLIISCSEDVLTPLDPVLNEEESFLKSANSLSVNNILFIDNFEDGDSQGWDLIGDGWSIETEAGNQVLSSSTSTGPAFAFLQNPGWYNYRFNSRLKFIGGFTYCELILRMDYLGQHYWLQVMSDHLALMKETSSGPFETLASSHVNILQNIWYNIEITAKGNKFKVKLNSHPVINVKDESPWGNIGTIGFEVHDNAEIYFDDVLVTRLGGSN
jgi:hypothetical protein